MPTVNEVEKGSTGFLDTLKRDLNEKQALDKSKEIIKKELNRLTDYKLLTDKAKPLAEDITKIIDSVSVKGAVKVNTRTGSGTKANETYTPIKPILDKNGIDVDYRNREGAKITITYNPADNVE